MSMFTQFNGPTLMPSTKAITELLDAYNTLSASLQRHCADTGDTNVHSLKSYIDNAIKDLATVQAVDTKITSLNIASTYATKKELTDGLVGKAATADVTNAANTANTAKQLADTTKRDLDSVKTTIGVLNDLAPTAKNTLVAAINEVNGKLLKFINDIGDASIVKTIKGTLDVTDRIAADMLQPKKAIDFMEWHKFTAQYAGSGTPGDTSTSGLYLIAMLSHDYSTTDMAEHTGTRSKPGRMYLKVLNSHPLNACIDFAVTAKNDSTYVGNMQVVCSKEANEWPGLRFHLVNGTDGDGVQHVWLAISCDKLPVGAQTGTLVAYGAGVNCFPVGYKGFKHASNVVHGITYTAIVDESTGQSVTNSITVNQVATDIIYDLKGNVIAQSMLYDDADGLDIGTKFYTLEIAKGGGDDGHGNQVKYRDVLFYTRPNVALSTQDGDTVKAPLITSHEADNLSVPVGAILRWPATAKTDVPTGYLRTDGSSVPATQYPDLAEVIAPGIDNMISLPNETHGIIRVSRYSIADATKAPDVPEVMNYLALSARLKAEIARSTAADKAVDIKLAGYSDNGTALSAKIDKEIKDRAAADTALSGRIDAESTARSQADAALEQSIDTEAKERIAADTNLLTLHGSTNARITKLHNGAHDAQSSGSVRLAPSSDATANIVVTSDNTASILAPYTVHTYTFTGTTSRHMNGAGVQGGWVGIGIVTEPTVTGFRYAWANDKSELVDWANRLGGLTPLEDNVDGAGHKGVALYIDKEQHATRYAILQLYDNADNYVYWFKLDATGVTVL